MDQRLKIRSTENRLSWEAVMFFAMYVISPGYFALELSPKLPLFTCSRILLILLGVMFLIRRRGEIFPIRNLKLSRWNFFLTEDKFLRNGLLGYFVLLVICNAALLWTDTGEALKAMFSVIVESYALVWLLTMILDTREKLEEALRVFVLSSAVVAVIVTVGCVFNCNPFYWLNTVQRDMLMAGSYRLALLRAEAGFGHPVYYGAFCAIITPINMYFVEHSENRREKLLFSGCQVMNLVGMVLSNSRGSLCAFACLVVLAAVIRVREKRFAEFFRTYLPISLAALGILAVVALTSPAGLAFLRGIFNSMINTVAPDTMSMDIVVDEDTVISYGKNSSGGRSRKAQLTGILWTMQRSPWVGLGSNAHMRGLVSYQDKPGIWSVRDTFDVALVAIICQYGILGLLGYAALFASIFRTTVAKQYRRDPLMQFLGLAFVTFLLCLITISSLDKVSWTLLAIIICLVNIMNKESAQTAQ